MATADTTGSATAEPAAWRRLLPFAVLSLLFLGLGLLPGVRAHLRADALRDAARGLGPWTPLAIALFALVSPLAFVPRWPVAFVCGLLYGVGWGSVLANLASTLGAWLHFRLARRAFGATAARLLPRAARWRDALSDPRTAFTALFLLRAFPLSNFTATNLLAAALGLPGRVYLGATFLGMIPSTLLYAALGKLLRRPSPGFAALVAALCVFLALGTLLARRRLGRSHRSF